MNTRFLNIPNKIIAITGGIASGKSTYCKKLEEKGEIVLYADKIVKNRIYSKPLVKKMILCHVKSITGQNITHLNQINFKKLRELAFTNNEVLSFLEKIVAEHFAGEFLKEYIEKKLNIPQIYNDITVHPYDPFYDLKWRDVYLEHPLVVQQGLADKFDMIVTCTAPIEERINRIIKRDSCSEEIARKIIEKQEGKV